MRAYFYILFICICFMPAEALAKAVFLPDYQDQYNSSRVTSGTLNHEREQSDCPSEYAETSASCAALGKVAAGTGCTDSKGTHYTGCVCDSSHYKSSCPAGQMADTASFCSDGEVTKYVCKDDPCYGLEDKATTYGCLKYYDQCSSKCELGKTCNPCGSEMKLSCPAGTICEAVECCDNTTKYQAVGCYVGFINWCVQPITDCATLGYTLYGGSCPAGTRLPCPYDGNRYACVN